MVSDLKRLRNESGSVVATAVIVMAIMIPIGLALLAIVDSEARQSGIERTRERAFEPRRERAAQRRSAGTCASSSYGATLGAPATAGSATPAQRNVVVSLVLPLRVNR